MDASKSEEKAGSEMQQIVTERAHSGNLHGQTLPIDDSQQNAQQQFQILALSPSGHPDGEQKANAVFSQKKQFDERDLKQLYENDNQLIQDKLMQAAVNQISDFVDDDDEDAENKRGIIENLNNIVDDSLYAELGIKARPENTSRGGNISDQFTRGMQVNKNVPLYQSFLSQQEKSTSQQSSLAKNITQRRISEHEAALAGSESQQSNWPLILALEQVPNYVDMYDSSCPSRTNIRDGSGQNLSDGVLSQPQVQSLSQTDVRTSQESMSHNEHASPDSKEEQRAGSSSLGETPIGLSGSHQKAFLGVQQTQSNLISHSFPKSSQFSGLRDRYDSGVYDGYAAGHQQQQPMQNNQFGSQIAQFSHIQPSKVNSNLHTTTQLKQYHGHQEDLQQDSQINSSISDQQKLQQNQLLHDTTNSSSAAFAHNARIFAPNVQQQMQLHHDQPQQLNSANASIFHYNNHDQDHQLLSTTSTTSNMMYSTPRQSLSKAFESQHLSGMSTYDNTPKVEQFSAEGLRMMVSMSGSPENNAAMQTLTTAKLHQQHNQYYNTNSNEKQSRVVMFNNGMSAQQPHYPMYQRESQGLIIQEQHQQQQQQTSSFISLHQQAAANHQMAQGQQQQMVSNSSPPRSGHHLLQTISSNSATPSPAKFHPSIQQEAAQQQQHAQQQQQQQLSTYSSPDGGSHFMHQSSQQYMHPQFTAATSSFSPHLSQSQQVQHHQQQQHQHHQMYYPTAAPDGNTQSSLPHEHHYHPHNQFQQQQQQLDYHQHHHQGQQQQQLMQQHQYATPADYHTHHFGTNSNDNNNSYQYHNGSVGGDSTQSYHHVLHPHQLQQQHQQYQHMQAQSQYQQHQAATMSQQQQHQQQSAMHQLQHSFADLQINTANFHGGSSSGAASAAVAGKGPSGSACGSQQMTSTTTAATLSSQQQRTPGGKTSAISSRHQNHHQQMDKSMACSKNAATALVGHPQKTTTQSNNAASNQQRQTQKIYASKSEANSNKSGFSGMIAGSYGGSGSHKTQTTATHSNNTTEGGGGGNNNNNNNGNSGEQHLQQLIDKMQNLPATASWNEKQAILTGNITRLVTTQTGSKYLQNAQLTKSNPVLIEFLLSEIGEQLSPIMRNQYGNYFFQKLLSNCSVHQRLQILHMIKDDFIKICCHKQGTHTIQAILDNVTTEEEETFIKQALQGYVYELSIDEQGTHVIRKVLQCRSFDQDKQSFIFQKIYEKLNQLCKNKQGLCVIKIIIALTKTTDLKKRVIQQIQRNLIELVSDPYGNYAVSTIVEKWEPKICQPIFVKLANKISELSIQKYSSCVIEKCLESHDRETRSIFIREISDTPRLFALVSHNYGNFVIQKALKLAQGQEKDYLVGAIEHCIPQIQDKKIRAKWQEIIENSRNGDCFVIEQRPMSQYAQDGFSNEHDPQQFYQGGDQSTIDYGANNGQNVHYESLERTAEQRYQYRAKTNNAAAQNNHNNYRQQNQNMQKGGGGFSKRNSHNSHHAFMNENNNSSAASDTSIGSRNTTGNQQSSQQSSQHSQQSSRAGGGFNSQRSHGNKSKKQTAATAGGNRRSNKQQYCDQK